MQHAAIHASHARLPTRKTTLRVLPEPLLGLQKSSCFKVILLCFRPDKPDSMTSIRTKWLQQPLRNSAKEPNGNRAHIRSGRCYGRLSLRLPGCLSPWRRTCASAPRLESKQRSRGKHAKRQRGKEGCSQRDGRAEYHKDVGRLRFSAFARHRHVVIKCLWLLGGNVPRHCIRA